MKSRDEMIAELEAYCVDSDCLHGGCKLYSVCQSEHAEAFIEMDDKTIREIYTVFTGNDPVESPNHYTVGGIEVIDYIKAKLTDDEFKGYCKGNILKYLSRAGHKDDEAQEYGKAMKYMEWLCKSC